MSIWFTADTHFNHENIIEYSSRPFPGLYQMTDKIIDNWNYRVLPGDTIYHLGDFALSWGKKHAEVIDRLLARLNGQKFLVKGNHDRDEVTKNPRWVQVKDYHEIKVDLGDVHKQRIVMSHYAMRTWNQMHRGAWMLHGHSHGSLEDIGGKTLDVGVDCYDFHPVSLGEVAESMRLREVTSYDHHEPSEIIKELER